MSALSVFYRSLLRELCLWPLVVLFCLAGRAQAPLRLQVESQQPPTGCAAADGRITLKAAGGRPGYRYSLDLANFQRSPVFTGLAAGIYTFYLVDKSLAIRAVSVSLNGNCPIRLGFSYSLYVCGIGGFIHVTQAFGGNGPYQFALDGGQFRSGRNFDLLPAGMHHLRVRDANGQILDYALPMYPVCDRSLTAEIVNSSCDAGNGSLKIQIAGAGRYAYALNGGAFQNGPLFPNLAPGSYDVTVRAPDGETSQVLGLRIGSDCPKVSATPGDETCGRRDGSITATGSFGTAPYTYSVDGLHYQDANRFAGLAAGNYTLTVKDVNGFTGSVAVTIGSSCITIGLQVDPATCNRSDGRITVLASDGQPPYEYALNGGAFGPSNIFPGQPAGNFEITVRDDKRVLNSKKGAVNNLTAAVLTPVAAAATCLNTDGSIVAAATGGVMPFTFAVDNGAYQASDSFPGVTSGDHIVLVKDGNGCTGSAPVTVPLNNNLFLGPLTDPTICEGTAVTLSPVSNAASATWSPADELDDPAALHPTASPKTSTTYTLTAGLGICSTTGIVTVFVHPAPVADAGPDQVICYGKNTRLHGIGGAQYAWQPAAALSHADVPDPVVRQPVTSTLFTLVVTDVNGCASVAPDSMRLTVTPPALLFAGNDTIVSPGEPVQLQATDRNGTGFTRYTWSPAAGLDDPDIAAPVSRIYSDITYTVTAATAEGCEGTDVINIRVIRGPEIYVPNAFTPNGDGHNDVLRPVTPGIRTLTGFSVYNRLGQRLFYTRDPGKGWDGTVNGQPQQTGAVVWIVEGIDYTGKKIQRTGSSLLIR